MRANPFTLSNKKSTPTPTGTAKYTPRENVVKQAYAATTNTVAAKAKRAWLRATTNSRKANGTVNAKKPSNAAPPTFISQNKAVVL
jgi:hypothetical protein